MRRSLLLLRAAAPTRGPAGHELSAAEIELFVQGVTHEVVSNEQIGAMLMAIYLKGRSFSLRARARARSRVLARQA